MCAKLLLAAVVSAICCYAATAQPVLAGSPVSGKLGYEPGRYFSEAIVTPATSTAYISGMTGGTNATDIRGQTKTAMDSLNATLVGLGSSLDAVVKTTIFMTNISNFNDMNAVYVPYFTPNSSLPARSTVQVASLVGITQIEVKLLALCYRDDCCRPHICHNESLILRVPSTTSSLKALALLPVALDHGLIKG